MNAAEHPDVAAGRASSDRVVSDFIDFFTANEVTHNLIL